MQPIGYKNHARVFSSVVDASLKIACAADGVKKGPIFFVIIHIYTVIRKYVEALYTIAKFVLPYMCYI